MADAALGPGVGRFAGTTSWPDMESDAITFISMQNGLRTGLERRLVEHRQEFELYVRQQDKCAEDAAFQRSEAWTNSTLQELREEVQQDVSAARSQIQQLEQRATEAELRLERLEARVTEQQQCLDAQFAEASAARAALSSELRTSVAELVAKDAEADRQRLCTEETWRNELHKLADTSVTARADIAQRAQEQLDQVRRQLADRCNSCEAGAARLHEGLVRANEDMKLCEQALRTALTCEEEARRSLAEKVQQQFHETYAMAEDLMQASAASIRSELNAAEDKASLASANLAERLGGLSDKLSRDVTSAFNHTDSLREEHLRAIRDTAAMFESHLLEAKRLLSTDIDQIRSRCIESEARVEDLATKAEHRAVEVAGRRMEAVSAAAQQQLNSVHASLSGHLGDLRAEVAEKTRLATEEAAKGDRDARTFAEAHVSEAVLRTSSLLRAEFADGLRDQRKQLETLLAAETERCLRGRWVAQT